MIYLIIRPESKGLRKRIEKVDHLNHILSQPPLLGELG